MGSAVMAEQLWVVWETWVQETLPVCVDVVLEKEILTMMPTLARNERALSVPA